MWSHHEGPTNTQIKEVFCFSFMRFEKKLHGSIICIPQNTPIASVHEWWYLVSLQSDANHRHNPVLEHFHHPRRFPLAHLQWMPASAPPLPLHSASTDLRFLQNSRQSDSLVHLCLASLTYHDVLQAHPCWLWIGGRCQLVSEQHFIVWTHHTVFIDSPVDGLNGLFPVCRY